MVYFAGLAETPGRGPNRGIHCLGTHLPILERLLQPHPGPAPRLHPEASEQIRRFILLSLQGSAPPGPEGPDAGRGGAGTPGPAQTAPLCSKTPPGSADAALHVTPEPGKHGGGHPVSVAAVPDPRLEAQRGIPSVLSGQWVRWVTVGRALVHSGRWLRAPSQRPRCARSSPPRCPLVLGPA